MLQEEPEVRVINAEGEQTEKVVFLFIKVPIIPNLVLFHLKTYFLLTEIIMIFMFNDKFSVISPYIWTI